MDRLPLEIKTSICSSLDHRGLVGFSLTAKHCNQAARTVLFSRLHISFTTADALQTRIEGIFNILERVSGLEHVRYPEVVAATITPCSVSDADCGDRPQDTWQYYAPYGNPSQDLEHDSEWLPLAQLVSQCPGLRLFT